MFQPLFTTHPDDHNPLSPIRPRKGVIIGAGQVGMACAYSLLIQNCFDELILQDINQEKAEGEVMDLVHGLSFIEPTQVTVGTVADAGRDADLVIITAGASQRPGETRLDLVGRNVEIFKKLIGDIAEYCPNAILLIVANPVDIMTYVSLKLSGFPSSRVIGSGTVLDTARFRYLLAEKLKLDPRSIHAYIIGEHGDSEVPVWSKVNVAGMKICDGDWEGCPPCEHEELQDIFQQVKNAAYEIIQRKGYTSYAIGLGVTDIVTAILRDQNRIITVSRSVQGLYGLPELCVSLPVLVNRKGATKIINLSLTETEEKQLQNSCKVLYEIIEKLHL
ncbi:L-lactate dehydrogenase [Planktothrix pseudagardhii]|uniref:L-lactate dehydrogenase n=1 Tax=Planktothrix pseudagardhii TaxID=132604 RepID=A0A9W4GAU7_9CYAN|nr:L-lactate dehydrogenase [Planktothrix pseudagardhii]CAD5979235.1 L-lactate dehydrogenase [Planktothrix pseudagardhii]